MIWGIALAFYGGNMFTQNDVKMSYVPVIVNVQRRNILFFLIIWKKSAFKCIQIISQLAISIDHTWKLEHCECKKMYFIFLDRIVWCKQSKEIYSISWSQNPYLNIAERNRKQWILESTTSKYNNYITPNLFLLSNQISRSMIYLCKHTHHLWILNTIQGLPVFKCLMLSSNCRTNPAIIKTCGIQNHNLHLVLKFTLGQFPVMWRFHGETAVCNAKGAININLQLTTLSSFIQETIRE